MLKRPSEPGSDPDSAIRTKAKHNSILEELPPELICLIFDNLRWKHYLPLRHVSKHINAVCDLHVFSKSYYFRLSNEEKLDSLRHLETLAEGLDKRRKNQFRKLVSTGTAEPFKPSDAEIVNLLTGRHYPSYEDDHHKPWKLCRTSFSIALTLTEFRDGAFAKELEALKISGKIHVTQELLGSFPKLNRFECQSTSVARGIDLSKTAIKELKVTPHHPCRPFLQHGEKLVEAEIYECGQVDVGLFDLIATNCPLLKSLQIYATKYAKATLDNHSLKKLALLLSPEDVEETDGDVVHAVRSLDSFKALKHVQFQLGFLLLSDLREIFQAFDRHPTLQVVEVELVDTGEPFVQLSLDLVEVFRLLQRKTTRYNFIGKGRAYKELRGKLARFPFVSVLNSLTLIHND